MLSWYAVSAYSPITVYSEIYRFRKFLPGNKAPELRSEVYRRSKQAPFFSYCHAPQQPRVLDVVESSSLSCEIFPLNILINLASEPLLTVQRSTFPIHLTLLYVTSVKTGPATLSKYVLLHELNPSPLQWSEFEIKCTNDCH